LSIQITAEEEAMKSSKDIVRGWTVILISLFALAGCAGSATQKSTGEYIDDAAITTKIKAGFVEDPTVSALAITVETFRGNVQLGGFASNAREIERAGQIARSVHGVKAVENDIRLKPAD
jgi:osmotically-inducible protein OsmY